MSTDKREMILERILAICLGLKAGDTTILSAVRNRGLLSNERRPAVILLDGDEADTGLATFNGGRTPFRPSLVAMKPELYIDLDERRGTNTGVGEDLNRYRMAISQAIVTDTQLATLVGSNGKVVYNGCVTDLKSGSALTGQMRLDFTYSYIFVPT